MDNALLEFILRHTDDEWERLTKEFRCIPADEYTWQPGPRVHSIAWHVRHAIEWRYALVHVLICGYPRNESLNSLGWENEPLIQAISDNKGWYDPRSTTADDEEFLNRVREITNKDMIRLSPERYVEVISFPWRTGALLDQIFQDVRHSALHRGHIRELKKMRRASMTDHRIFGVVGRSLAIGD
jgi:DinB superfamily